MKTKGVDIGVYEPVLHEEEFFGSRVIRDLAVFKGQVDVILGG